MSKLGELRLLSSRLREELSKDPWDDEAIRPLAAAYNGYCRALRTRLDQVQAVLEAGEAAQAIDLAETDPPVLDQLTILGSPEIADLAAWCEDTGLPFEGRFDGQLIHRINEAFSDSGARDGSLEKTYRGAVLRKDFEVAISALRSMLRSRPDDKRLKEELDGVIDRYGKALAKKLERNADLEEQKDLVEKIEDLGRRDLLDLPGVEAVRKKLRQEDDRNLERTINELLTEAKSYESLDTWEHFEECYGRVSLLLEQLSREADEGILHRWEELQQSERQLRERWAAARERQVAANQLDSVVRTATQRRVKAEALDDEKLEKGLDSLITAAGRAEKAGAEIDEDLKERWKREVNELRTVKARRVKERRKRKIVAGVVATLVLGGILLLVADYLRFRNFSSDVETVLLQKNGVSARQIVANFQKSPPASIFRNGMSGKVDQLIAFLRRDERIVAKINTGLEELQTLFEKGDGVSPSEIAGADKKVRETADQLEGVSVENRTDLLPRWKAVRDQLELARAQVVARIREQVDQSLAEVAPDFENGLSLSSRPEELRDKIARVDGVLSAINETYAPWAESVDLREDQKEQMRLVKEAAQRAETQLRLHDNLAVRIETASSIDDYNAAIKALSSLQYPGSCLTGLSQTVGHELDKDLLTRTLISKKYPLLSNWINAEHLPGLVPKGGLVPSEEEAYMDLLNDGNLFDIYEATFDQDGAGWQKPRTIFSKGSLRIVSRSTFSGRTQQGVTGRIYVPYLSPFEVDFSLQEDKQLVNLQQKGEIPESLFFQQLGLDRNISGSGQIIPTDERPAPFLDVIDRTLTSEKLDPLFKIYLIQKFYRVITIADRESSWGLDFMPPLPSQFRDLLDFSVKSGAWMFPADDEFPANKRRAEEAADLVEALEEVMPPLQGSVLFVRKLVRNFRESRLEFVETKIPDSELTFEPDKDRSLIALVGNSHNAKWARLDENNAGDIIDFSPVLEFVPSFSEIRRSAVKQSDLSRDLVERIFGFLKDGNGQI